MLNLNENRDNLIKRAISSIQEDYEYESSEIIKALFESASAPEPSFKDRKIHEAQAAKKRLEENTFFKNSSSYIKRKEIADTANTKDRNE